MPENSPNLATEAGDLITQWEDASRSDAYDPSPTLKRLAEIVEYETNLYLRKDPDPFDDRHPSRADPKSSLGAVLKVILKKDSFYNKLTGDYMRDNFFGTTQTDKNFELNTQACRLLLNLMPGLEVGVVFTDSETLLQRLYHWAEREIEPICSYAIGLLAAAMEITDIASLHREKSAQFVPRLLQRLVDLQSQYFKSCADGEAEVPRPRQASANAEGTRKRPSSSLASSIKSPPSKRARISGPSSPRVLDESSNSSWVESNPWLISTYSIHPVTPEVQQIFILRYMTPLGEYQELLSVVFKNNVIELLLRYTDFSVQRSARLAFEALKYLASLLCHKKVALEFVQMDGLSQLLGVPRPSIAATGVSVCLYYLATIPDAVERLCYYSEEIIEKLIRYELWLLECSHNSGRCQATLFFALVFRYRALMEVFDELDGLRILFNTLSTLKVLDPDPQGQRESTDEDEELNAKQCMRHTCNALAKYFEAHLFLLAENVAEVNTYEPRLAASPASSIGRSSVKNLGASNSVRIMEPVGDRHQLILELSGARRSSWAPVSKFAQLGGITLLFRVIGMSFTGNFQGRAECIKHALEVLEICAISPLAQELYKSKFELRNGEGQLHQLNGMAVILTACEGEYCTDPEVQKGALRAIIPCICAPYPQAMSRSIAATPSDVQRQLKLYKTEDTLSRKMRECVRANNGIMILYNLMRAKTPLTDADEIRALACQALAGLARSESVRQVIGKHSLLSEMTSFLREPVLPEKKREHLRFSKYFTELLELVSGGVTQVPGKGFDLSMEALHRMDVVARTKIRYNKKQVLMMIQQHLAAEGLHDSAAALAKEANLPHMAPPVPITPARPSLLQQQRLLHQHHSLDRTSLGNVSSTPVNGSGPPSTPLRLVLQHRNIAQSPAAAVAKSLHKQSAAPTILMPPAKKTVTLDKLVTEYLMNQHARCKNPMITCPEFDLFLPHKCPERSTGIQAPWNLAARLQQRQIFPKYGGRDGAAMMRRLIWSRFCPLQPVYRSSEPDDQIAFQACEFSACGQFIMAGDDTGQLRLMNYVTGAEEGSYSCHDGTVTSIQPYKDASLLLTSSYGASAGPKSCLWSIGEFFECKHSFSDDDHVEWGKSRSQDIIVGTMRETAKIYDAHTGRLTVTLTPPEGYHNGYIQNKATFSPSDELVFSDGVLWDVRSSKVVHKFDKFQQTINGVFHPNGLHVVSSTEVWDIRTFYLLKQVPGLKYRDVKFNHAGDVFFGIPNAAFQEEDDPGYPSSFSDFRTFDAHDYSSIATIEVKRDIADLAINLKDLEIIVVENTAEDSLIRRYDVGRRKELDLGAEREEEDEEGNNDDEDDDDRHSGSDMSFLPEDDSLIQWFNDLGNARRRDGGHENGDQDEDGPDEDDFVEMFLDDASTNDDEPNDDDSDDYTTLSSDSDDDEPPPQPTRRRAVRPARGRRRPRPQQRRPQQRNQQGDSQESQEDDVPQETAASTAEGQEQPASSARDPPASEDALYDEDADDEERARAAASALSRMFNNR